MTTHVNMMHCITQCAVNRFVTQQGRLLQCSRKKLDPISIDQTRSSHEPLDPDRRLICKKMLDLSAADSVVSLSKSCMPQAQCYYLQ